MALRADLRAAARQRVELDAGHRALIDSIGGYDDRRQLLTTTLAELAHYATRGAFAPAADVECFAFPMWNSSWEVYADMTGPLWSDGRAVFNRHLPLGVACAHFGGQRDDESGAFTFWNVEAATDAARALGDSIDIPEFARERPITLSISRDSRLVISFPAESTDTPPPGWLLKRRQWVRGGTWPISVQADGRDFDNQVRKLTADGSKNAGWRVCTTSGVWCSVTKYDARDALIASGVPKRETESILGTAVLNPWRLVSIPFQDEYPGERQWNIDTAQYAIEPVEGEHPHWDLIMRHCGRDLDSYIRDLVWCLEDGIQTGGDYLTAWLACMLREPFEHLPYLFFFGEENTGKSIFHEAARLLMTKGVVIADHALTSSSDFNGELASAVLCVVEEKDISRAPGAMAKIKEWVTGEILSIQKKGLDCYSQRNTTHWVQCANHRRNCPVKFGDTRVTVIEVTHPESEIPKPELRDLLRDEAPAFLHTLLNRPLPKVRGRLRLPVIETAHKAKPKDAQLLEFVSSRLISAPHKVVAVSRLHGEFLTTLSDIDRPAWEHREKFGRALSELGYKSATKTASRTKHLIDVMLRDDNGQS